MKAFRAWEKASWDPQTLHLFPLLSPSLYRPWDRKLIRTEFSHSYFLKLASTDGKQDKLEMMMQGAEKSEQFALIGKWGSFLHRLKYYLEAWFCTSLVPSFSRWLLKPLEVFSPATFCMKSLGEILVTSKSFNARGTMITNMAQQSSNYNSTCFPDIV